jgi:hypothetical protein
LSWVARVAGALLLTCALVASGAAGSYASVRRADVSATRLFLRALDAFARAQIADAPAQQAAMRAGVRQLSTECPNVVAHAPAPRTARSVVKLIEVGAVIGVAVAYPAEAIERPAIAAFAATVEHLRWSDRRVTRSVRALVEQELAGLAVPSQELCNELRSWVSSGYRELPASAKNIIAKLPPLPLLPGSILPQLTRYEGPKLRTLARRVDALTQRVLLLQVINVGEVIAEANAALGLPAPPPPRAPPRPPVLPPPPRS